MSFDGPVLVEDLGADDASIDPLTLLWEAATGTEASAFTCCLQSRSGGLCAWPEVVALRTEVDELRVRARQVESILEATEERIHWGELLEVVARSIGRAGASVAELEATVQEPGSS